MPRYARRPRATWCPALDDEEFKEELRELFDSVLAALPDDPVDPRRLQFEEGRRRRNREALALKK